MRPQRVPSLPYLAPWYRVATRDGSVLLEHGQRVVTLEGRAAERLVPALLPLLDGRRTLDDIVRVLGPPVRPAVEHALAALAEHGVLEEGPPLPDHLPRPAVGTAELLASLRPAGRPVAETGSAVAACSVGVAGEGTAGVELTRLLRSSGVDVRRVESVEPGVDVTVCAPSSSERPRLSEWNAQALDVRAAWLQLLPFDGRYASIGPLYLPADTCCFECFRLRRQANLEAGVELSELDGSAASDAPVPALDAIVGGLAAILACGWLVHGDHYAPGSFYALELLPTLGLTVHHVYRVPRCPACSGLTDVSPPLPWHKEVPVGDGR
jgi:bacteriocin biosynthesis cyclodehydratase domain-containing protein